MSKNTFNKIISKLERLDEYLKYLTELQKVNKKSFLTDYHFYGLAERYLQLSIEILLDIGKLIIIAENLRKPEENSEIFIILNENKILPSKLSHDLTGITSFRNILVHDYEKIDRNIVYIKLQNNLEQFKSFKRNILKFLKKQM